MTDRDVSDDSETVEESFLAAEIEYQRDWLDVVLKLAIVALLALLVVLATMQINRTVEVRITPVVPSGHTDDPPDLRT